MIEILKIWIINIITIIVFISFIEILMPNSKMKKYLNLVLGFIVMLVILNPLINIINSKVDLEDEFYKISRDLKKEEYVFVSNNIENKQKQQLISLYEDRLKTDVVNRIESKYDVNVLEIDINLEKSEENLGEIKKLKLSVIEKEKVMPIVKIDIFKDENDEESEKHGVDMELKEKIRKDISNIYNVKNTRIIVN
ncbi:MAG: stage sporulation protein [Candidatus Petromonas sp.]|jgi:stage III sporulation protein AF|nr:stage sporulation protein [Candidatus Petromonas sp.]